MTEDIGSMYDLRFNINYYGADYPIDTLVRKLNKDEIYIPSFQRQYVWNVKEASLFIESILLGLPIPTVFLAKDKYTNRLLIIDGQQRLKTLQFFTRGYFPDQKPFKLKGVISQFNGLTFQELDSKDKYNLMDFTIHATVIAETGDSNRMYYLFERLNTTGTPLTAQEIRNAIYHGPFSDLIGSLSTNSFWKELYGKDDKRLRDHELILRFFALNFAFQEYRGNMKDFLNEFMLNNRILDSLNGHKLDLIFNRTIELIYKNVGPKAFKLNKIFNTAFFDVIMLTISWEHNNLDTDIIATWHKFLMEDQEFRDLLQARTTNRESIYSRIEYARSILRNI